jgi:hypothetical protein
MLYICHDNMVGIMNGLQAERPGLIFLDVSGIFLCAIASRSDVGSI